MKIDVEREDKKNLSAEEVSKHPFSAKYYNKFSAILNSNKSIVSVVDMEICDQFCILALDCFGLVNLWAINEDIFSYKDKPDDELIDFSNYNILYPDISFDIKRNILKSNSKYSEHLDYYSIDKKLHFSKMQKLNGNSLIFCGDFNTFLVKKDQIENKLSNFLNESKSKNKNMSIEVKLLDQDMIINDYILDNGAFINGIDIDYVNNKFITYSDNGSLFLFDLNTCELIQGLNIDNTPQFKTLHSTSSILSAKIIPKNNTICVGTNEGNLNFIDYNSYKNIGFLNVCLNKFISNKEFKESNFESEIDHRENINCMELSPNYLLVGCDNFAFKYNYEINLITQVLPFYGQVNALAFDHDFTEIFVGTDSNKLLKYNTMGKKRSTITVSSNSIYSLDNISIFNKNSICCSGNSNFIDFICDDIILKLIY